MPVTLSAHARQSLPVTLSAQLYRRLALCGKERPALFIPARDEPAARDDGSPAVKADGSPRDATEAPLSHVQANLAGLARGCPDRPGNHRRRRTPLNTPVGKYVVRYADKTRAEVEVAYGRDVVHWWVQAGVADPTRGKVAWEGENRCSRVKLFLTTWENPHPDKVIFALDYVTTKHNPFCVAIAAEE